MGKYGIELVVGKMWSYRLACLKELLRSANLEVVIQVDGTPTRSYGVLPYSVEERRLSKGAGNGKLEVHRWLGGGNCGVVVEDCNIVFWSWCTLKKLVAVNARITVNQRAALEATVWRPCLNYRDISMERHLTLNLIKYWVPQWKAFRILDRRVPFSMFDGFSVMGLLATERRVEFDWDEVSSDVGLLICGRIAK